jgi:hypothetical protein
LVGGDPGAVLLFAPVAVDGVGGDDRDEGSKDHGACSPPSFGAAQSAPLACQFASEPAIRAARRVQLGLRAARRGLGVPSVRACGSQLGGLGGQRTSGGRHPDFEGVDPVVATASVEERPNGDAYTDQEYGDQCLRGRDARVFT